MQGKLLRVVQEGTFRPIGASKEKKVDVKIIAAMNVDPIVAIEKNILRKDLFYRLSGNMLYLLPLRERKDDIEYLTDKYIDYFNETYGKQVTGISEKLREFFLTYEWEGNVRELKHVIESMVSMAKEDVLQFSQIPLYLHSKLKGVKGFENEKQKLEHAEDDNIVVDFAVRITTCAGRWSRWNGA